MKTKTKQVIDKLISNAIDSFRKELDRNKAEMKHAKLKLLVKYREGLE